MVLSRFFGPNHKIVQIHLKAKQYIVFFLCLVCASSFYAQIVPPETDSLKDSRPDLRLLQDSIPGRSFPGPAPATNVRTVNLDSVNIASDGLDEVIDYNAEDSMRFDVANKVVYLYGNAVVTYNTMKMTANYIEFDMENSLVTAAGYADSSGTLSGYPVFEEKDQKFEAKKVRYNFKTSKGIIYEATTTERDLYVLGNKAQWLGEDAKENRKTDIVYSEDAIFTTCSHPEPHFGIRSRKQKVIPNDVVVVGPSNLEIGGVPSPLWLPFAFFPLKQGPRTGLIFPRNYEFSERWGFGLQDVGWYFPINDYMDLTVTGRIYTRGTWGIRANTKYRKRYKYNGNFTFDYWDRRQEQLAQTLSQKSFIIQWTHNQDPKAHPTNRFSSSVNIQTNNSQQLNNNDAERVLNNTLASTISFSKTFPGKPYTLTMSMNHSQNNQTRQVAVTLPRMSFNINRIYPFRRKNAPSSEEEKWFEKITFQYKGDMQNQFTATDTTLFSQETLESTRFGVRHALNSNASFRVFKYFNLTPTIDYSENWYIDRTRKVLDEVYEVDSIFGQTVPGEEPELLELDTTQYGEIVTMREFGWNPLRRFNTSLSLGTQIFGVRQFNKGKIRGIRHIIKPSLAFNYTPDYTSDRFGYFDFVDSDLRPSENDPIRYSLFESGVYDMPSDAGRIMGLSYTINQIFEGKFWSKRDSSIKDFKFFDNIFVRGNYNFAADSLQWSTVNINGTTRLFGGITTFNFSSAFDPYAIDENGRRINVFQKQTGGGYLRYINTNLRFNTGMTVKSLMELITGKKDKNEDSRSPAANRDTPPTLPQQQPASVSQAVASGEGLLELFSNWRISHNLIMESNPDTFFIRTNSIQTNGSIQLTPKWSVRFGNISYDFKAKALVYPTLGFYRDLHCWQMGMDWFPERGTFTFFLRVKPGSLDFIKVPYGRGNQDGFRGF